MNWLFIGAADVGERGAILYMIVEPERSKDRSRVAEPEGQTTVRQCCRRRGINPYAYLRDVLTRLPKMDITKIGQVTPEAWQMAQRATQRRQAA